MSYDLVSFDLDGTLVDTAAEIAEAANAALELHGIARRPVEEITLMIGAGTRQLMLGLLARCCREDACLAGRVNADHLIAAMDERYGYTAGRSAKPYAGCHETLSALRSAGVRLACVTNKEMRHARRVLEASRLDGWFDLVIGGDSLAEKKPHATVLRQVARTLGVPIERMAHVGDSAIDVAAARNAGVAAWAVPYGYNAGVAVAESRPDRLFDNLLQVAAHVLDARAGSSIPGLPA